MDTQVNPTPLPAVTVIEGYTVEQALESEPNVLRYSARNAGGDRVVLVELFPPETVVRDGLKVALRNPEDQEGWQAWIRSFSERTRQLAALNHQGLVKLRHSFIANGTAYCVIEPIGGETLSSVLEREGTLPEPRLRQLLFSLISALEEAHNVGLLHGDIEPSRIRLQFDGKAILSGFATLVTPIRFKAHTTVNAGTPGYAPPEHLLVQAAEQPSSDIYSLAAIAYRAICGEAPPEARMRGAGAELKPSALAARGRYSAALTNAIDAGLAMRAQQRPQTLAQWRQLLESEEAVATGPSRPAPKKSSPVVWVAGPAVVVLLIAGYFIARGDKTPAPAPAPAATVLPSQPSAVAPTTLESSPSSSTALPTPTLDQLAISMLKRGQKPVHANAPESSQASAASAKQPLAAGAPPAGKPGQAVAGPVPASAPPAGAAIQAGSKSPEAQGAGAATAAAPPAAPAATDAEQLKQQEALQKAAQDEAARQSQKEASAKEAAAKEALAKQAAINEAADRIRKTVARAKAKCEIPAPELSENQNLVYENAMAVPGAKRLSNGTIRLPEVTLPDGTTAQFAVDRDSCAHRVD